MNLLPAAQLICDAIHWDLPELEKSTAYRKFSAGKITDAAIEVMRYLRTRKTPDMGYSADYIKKLRANASPDFRKHAQTVINQTLTAPFLGGSHPDGRGTLLALRPEIIQVAATQSDFILFARIIAESRDCWQQGAQHTAGRILRYLQIVWPLVECPDAALVPLFGFLLMQLETEWEKAKKWNEASLGCQGHNWWVAEFGRIGEIGILFPEFHGFSRFRAFVPALLEKEMDTLIANDGFTREMSMSYHTGTSDLFLDVVRTAARNGLSFSTNFMNKLRLMYDVEWKFITPDGTHPPFGDIFNPPGYEFKRMASIAAIMGIPEAKYLAECAGEPDATFGKMLVEALHYPAIGEDLRSAYNAVPATQPDATDYALPDSGYYVMRQNWSQKTDYAAIEASTKGNLVTSHGHGAIFDLQLYSRGRPILIGNGKGPCGTTDPESTWRHESMSHNVAIVDGKSHLPLRSSYRFSQVVLPVVDRWISTPRYCYFSGAHEAYERFEKKVPCCRRKIFYLRGEYWILIDRFTPASTEDTHHYQQRFQLAPDCEITKDGRVITRGDGGNLMFLPLGIPPKIACDPLPWPYENHPEPHQLTFSQTQKGPCVLIMLLVPFLDREIPEITARLLPINCDERRLSPWEASGIEIMINGRRHLYFDQHMEWNLPWKMAEATGSNRLYHSACC